MEILSYLIQHHIKGEILHGAPDYITARIQQLFKAAHARKQLQGSRLGIIGQPSDWLISSTVDKDIIRQQLGINLIDIPIEELEETIQSVNGQSSKETSPVASIQRALPDAERIYTALKILVERYRLQGFTLRCFDLLTSIRNTGCLALARLNAEGVVAGCEGDIPAMLSMTMVRSLLGISGFQANPAHINPETGEILFAHCTIPLNMVERYELDTHFESGIGVGIRGYMKEGPVTIFKVSGDLSHSFIAEGELVHNQAKPDLCRTQQVIRLSEKDQVHYFLTHPIGNHHIILPGHQKALLEELLKTQ
jgi:L-fucose isomerase-like protein